MSLFELSYVALWALVVVLALAVYALYHHFGQMYLTSPEGRATQGPPVGKRLQTAHGTPLEGPTLVLPQQSQRTVLLFTEPDCAVCRQVLDDLDSDGDTEILEDVVVVSSGTAADAGKWLSILPATRILMDPRAGLRSRYGIGVTPFGVATDAEGVVRTRGVVSNGSNLRGLIMQARIDERAAIEAAKKTGHLDLAKSEG
jgi:hypothetical protein